MEDNKGATSIRGSFTEDVLSRLAQMEEQLGRFIGQSTDNSSSTASLSQTTSRVTGQPVSAGECKEHAAMERQTSRIAQAQGEKLQRIKDRGQNKEEQTLAKANPNDEKVEQLMSEVACLVLENGNLNQRIETLEAKENETNSSISKSDEMVTATKDRVRMCETKIDKLNNQYKTIECQVGQILAGISEHKQAKERAFQTHISHAVPLKLLTDVFLSEAKEIFWLSIHFNRKTCIYTIPESGLYEFYIRWRQSNKGALLMTIHWGEDRISRLGQTDTGNFVVNSTIRRILEKGTEVRISVRVTEGKPLLEACDFGGSFIAARPIQDK